MSNLSVKAKWRFGSMLLTATNNVVATTQMLSGQTSGLLNILLIFSLC